MVQSASQPSPTHWWNTPEFLRSLPLFVLAAVFFVAGGVLRFAYPTYALYGPGVFTFWALLLALGFICCIGGVISWTLATDTTPAATEAPAEAATPAYLPIEFPAPAAPAAPPETPRAARGRSDFGRPAPDVRPSAADSGDWYEGPTDRERFEGPEYVLPVDVPETSPDSSEGERAGPEPVENVLADLERIERELAPRARVVEPSST